MVCRNAFCSTTNRHVGVKRCERAKITRAIARIVARYDKLLRVISILPRLGYAKDYVKVANATRIT